MAERPQKLESTNINPYTRLAATCRRFQFEVYKSLGILWLIERIPGLKIKEPYNKLYKRANGKYIHNS